MVLKMPTIEERESEHDNEEELNRKAETYTKKIDRLRKDVENLKLQLSSMQSQNEEHKTKLIKKEAQEMLYEREKHITTLEDSLARINLEVHQYKCRNQIVDELLEYTPGQIQEGDLDKLIAMYTGMIE